MNYQFRALSAVTLLGLAAIAGCGSATKVDPAEVAKHRTRLTLTDEPDGAQTVLDVRAAMFGDDPAALHAELQHAHDEAEHEHAEEHADEAEEHGDEHAAEDAEHHEEHAEETAEHNDEDHDHAEHELASFDPAAKPKVAEMDVVLVGMVGGVSNPTTQALPEFPFAKDQAMFFLADPEAAAEFEEHGHHHAEGEECAFCAAHAADAAALLAVVQFHDEKGKVLAVDARDLFDLKEKETVVVRGKAHIMPGGMLAVDAAGLYVRR